MLTEDSDAFLGDGFVSESKDAIFDPAGLLGHALDNRALARKLLDVYMLDLPVRGAALRAAVLAGNTELMRQQAHALKGASLVVGAEQLARLTQGFEDACRQNPAGCVLAVLPELEKLVMATREQMQAWMSEAPPWSNL